MYRTLTLDQDMESIVNAIQLSPLAMVITDNKQPHNPIIATNAAFTELTQYSAAEVIGRNCRFLSAEPADSTAREKMRGAIKDGRSVLVELLNHRKDGTSFRNAVMVAPVRDANGDVTCFVGSQMSVDMPSGFGMRSENARRLVAGLSPRLREILRLIASGFQNKQISAQLGICEQTVKMHRARLLRGLEVRTSSEAVRIAVEADVNLIDRG